MKQTYLFGQQNEESHVLTFLFCSKQQADDRSQATERVSFSDRAQVADEARDIDDGVGFRISAAARFADRQAGVSHLFFLFRIVYFSSNRLRISIVMLSEGQRRILLPILWLRWQG
jgi:hypothetical protein